MAAKHILVGTDFSEQSKHAVRAVAEYARAHGSSVTLVFVMDPHSFIPPQSVLQPIGDASRGEHHKAELDELRETLLAGIESHSIVLIDTSAARAICEYARENDIDAIAVGSHGHGRIESWLIGSVAERIVRHAKCSVFVFRE